MHMSPLGRDPRPARMVIAALVAFVLTAVRPAVAPGATLRAQAANDSTPVQKRTAQIVEMLNGAPLDLDTMFTSTFLSQVPAARLQAAVAQMTAQTGSVVSIATLAAPVVGDANSARFRFTTSKNFAIPVTIHVAAAPPNRIDGILFGAPTPLAANLDAVAASLRALHGHVSFMVSRVDNGSLVPLAEADSARALGIGSAFKLYILAELVREVAAGERRWTDLVTLDSARRSLPSGVTQAWPAGAPVTLQTLATLMISQSDNTAADALLHALGRERVERIQARVGTVTPARNMPFLSTREMFVLKSPAGAALMAQFKTGDVAARRVVLAEADHVPQADVNPDFSAGPVAIDSIEWFASAADLSRAMLWLRDHTGTAMTAPARAILAVNPGLNLSGGEWTYVGYKGGSEPGVLDLTLLLWHRSGAWYIVSATWNDPARVVDEATLIGLVQRAVDLVGAGSAAGGH